jgi:hypothetical protein
VSAHICGDTGVKTAECYRCDRVRANTRRDLDHTLDALNEDEARVVLTFAKRIRAGRDAYGPLDLTTDRRDFRKEAGEEALDLAAYLAFELVRRGHATTPLLGAMPDCEEP